MKLALTRLFGIAMGLACALAPHSEASAFSYVVAPGETLAQVSTTFYGTSKNETVLVGANALDARGGSAIVPGEPLEIPAPSYHRVAKEVAWAELARVYLGDARRADTLARANGMVAWTPPAIGQEIVVPAVIAVLATEADSMPQLAKRYLGDVNRAWELNAYNGRRGEQNVVRGDVILIPLVELALTEEGKKAAREAADRIATEGGGIAYQAQRRAEPDIPPMLADLRAGRYVDAVAKGNRLLGYGELTKPQLAAIHRALVEAYVALDAPGLAAGSCAAWRTNVEEPSLEPRLVSPKIRAACGAR